MKNRPERAGHKRTMSQQQYTGPRPYAANKEKRPRQQQTRTQHDSQQTSTMSQLPDHLLKQPNTTLILNIQNNYNSQIEQ